MNCVHPFFCHVPISPCLPSLCPFPRRLGLPVGLTLTTLPSARAAWIHLPAGLATCRWFTPRWGSTPSSLKTRSLFCARNTETLNDFKESSRVGKGKREGLDQAALFPVQTRSSAEPDCAKSPKADEQNDRKGQWELNPWLLGLHRTAPNAPPWLLCPKTRLCTV